MTKDALPGWLRTIYIGISDAPMTNLKSLNAMLLVNATALFLFVGAWFQVKLDQAAMDSWLIFLSGLVGFAVAGAGLKRATYKPTPPTPPDAEDVAATTATPSPTQSIAVSPIVAAHSYDAGA